MNSISEQMRTAQLVMEKVEQFDPTCILAGGAPRDWYFGNVAADLDIFFHTRKGSTFSMVYGLLERAFGKGVVKSIPFPDSVHLEHYKKNPNIVRVFELEFEGQKVQLIEMNNPTYQDVVDHFPLTICKIWYKGGFITPELEFLKSFNEKVIIKSNPVYADGDKYIWKIRNKFPDYKYFESYEHYFKWGNK